MTSIPPSLPSHFPIGSWQRGFDSDSSTHMPLTCVAQSGYVAELFYWHTFLLSRGRRLSGSLASAVIWLHFLFFFPGMNLKNQRPLYF